MSKKIKLEVSLKMNKFTYPISNLDELYEMVIKEFKKLGYPI